MMNENAYNKLEWIVEPYIPIQLCDQRRGKRGTVTCEKPRSVFHMEHAGRGKNGRWFFWLVK